MTRQLGAAPRVSAVLLALALLPCALLLGAPAARGEATVEYTKESLPQYESQLNAGEIQSVTVNKRLRSLRITLKDGRHVIVYYAPKTGPHYYAALKARGVPVTFLGTTAVKHTKPVHHKLRYIAGGLLIVALVIVGVVLYFNRRRQPAQDQQEPPAAPL
jgi:hypothetical protein